VSVSIPSVVASSNPTARVPFQSIWDDPLIVQKGPKGWHCGYCGSSWSYVNSSRVFKHLLPYYHAGKGINACTHDLISIPVHDKIRWEELAASQSQSSDRRRNETETASSQLSAKTRHLAHSIQESNDSKRSKTCVPAPSEDERRQYSQMSLEASLQQNGIRLTAAIANFVHSEGLPFSVVDKPTFHAMIAEARYAPAKYSIPNRRLIGGNLLDLTYATYFDANIAKLNVGIEMYGICLYGDSATIRRKPFLNILAASVNEPCIVLEIADATDHLKCGGKKDSAYVAKQFLPWMTKLDPQNTLLDCVFFDGAGDVQKAGRILAAINPRITVLHGAEHVVSLFCKDVAKLTPIKVVILKYKFLYRVFGSGSMHRPYAVFTKCAKEFNKGRKIGLLRPADTRMAGYFIALHRLLRLQKPLEAAHLSHEWDSYQFPTKSKQQKEAITAIVTDPVFWHEVSTIVIGMFPVLKCLRLADSNKAGMDKLYYYVRRTSEALRRTKYAFNGGGKQFCFEYRPATHKALGNVKDKEYPGDLRYFDDVEHDLDFGDNEVEEYADGCTDRNEVIMDADLDDGDSVDTYDLSTSSEMEPSLRKGLGDHMVFLWEKRKTQLISDFAVLGWLVSVVPEIILDAKSYNQSERERAERCLKQLWHPQSAIESNFQKNLNKFFDELSKFHNRQGPYANKRIWSDTYAITGQTHLWHHEHTVRFNYMSLGFTACRVASKILGIGAAERSWGDVKRIIGDRRLSLASTKIHKQSVIYTSNCIQAKKKELNLDDHTWKEWDLAMDEFNSHLERSSVIAQPAHKSGKEATDITEEGFFKHFTKSRTVSSSLRLFKAYEEDSIELNQSKPDSVTEAHIIAKYGGLFIADPDIDKQELVLRINSEQVYYQTGKRGTNRTYCVYGMAPNEDYVSEATELFSVTNDLIIRVICAENDNLNVVDREGCPVVAASYRESEFGSHNVNWDFVKIQKKGFLDYNTKTEAEEEPQKSISSDYI
jgi:hypothetical protein